jgi:uncharacterized membrane protein (UPF0127 family)
MDKNFLILILIIILAGIIYLIFFNNPPTNKINLNLNQKEYLLEVAKTIPQQTKGLMNRPSLCSNCGMIFVFNFEMTQTFWMKDTLIPLDIIFIDRHGLVTNIVTAVPEPNTPDSQLKLYRSSSPAKYVIELNAGDTNKLSLKSGDKINLSSL